ncbi:glycosyltransferase [Chryseobacterium wangxinyae]|uniref:glycosyltransferase n=1 Tax=Chryseobacterium sp. CY353 TaxID=2997334 RepID=UPI00226F792C|nr:glycosyltransferase [Chryseobacterium sp. CY353]MCY0969548.1 glycosyltransferase [Chryseobacterium sp. CY353]
MVKISVILPNYNGGKYLAQSIESFIGQDYITKELIIVDGKSTDNSHEIIEKYVQLYPNIIWVKEEDKGISNAFNIGFKYAKGNIIGYLGSDDIIFKGLFEEINYINSWSSFDSIYFNSYTFYINEKRCILRKCPDIEFNLNNLLSYGTIVGWQNIYFKREIYERYRIDESNKTCMDYEFYLQICSSEDLLFIQSDRISTINIFDGNISSDFNGTQMLEATNVAKKYASKTSYKGQLFGSRIVTKKQSILTSFKNLFIR